MKQQRLKYILKQVAMLVCRKRNMGDSAHDTASCIEMHVVLGIEKKIELNEGCSIKVNKTVYYVTRHSIMKSQEEYRLGALLLQCFE